MLFSNLPWPDRNPQPVPLPWLSGTGPKRRCALSSVTRAGAVSTNNLPTTLGSVPARSNSSRSPIATCQLLKRQPAIQFSR